MCRRGGDIKLVACANKFNMTLDDTTTVDDNLTRTNGNSAQMDSDYTMTDVSLDKMATDNKMTSMLPYNSPCNKMTRTDPDKMTLSGQDKTTEDKTSAAKGDPDPTSQQTAKEAEAKRAQKKKEEADRSPAATQISNKWQQLFVATTAAMSYVCHGFTYSQPAFLESQLTLPSEMGLTDDQRSWFVSFHVLGSLGGSILGGYQCDLVGRRNALIIDHLVFIAGYLSLGLAPNFWVLLIARYLQGHAAASCFVTMPIYISEVTQPALRGTAYSLNMGYYGLTFGIAMLLAAILPWRTLLLLESVVPVFFIVALCFCPDSPTWLLMKGKEEEARKALLFLRGKESLVNEECTRILGNIASQRKKPQTSCLAKAKKLFTKGSFLKPLALVLVMLCLGAEMSGCPAVAGYMISILQEAGIPMNPFMGAAFVAIYRGIVGFFSSQLVNKMKWRPLFFGSASLMFVGTFCFGLTSFFRQKGLLDGVAWAGWLPILCVALMYTSFSMGFGSVVYNIQGMVFPAESRSFACGLTGFLDNLFLFFVLKLIPTAITLIGLHGVFWMFSASTALTMVVCYFLMPETQGLTLEDIEYRFKSVKKRAAAEAEAAANA